MSIQILNNVCCLVVAGMLWPTDDSNLEADQQRFVWKVEVENLQNLP